MTLRFLILLPIAIALNATAETRDCRAARDKAITSREVADEPVDRRPQIAAHPRFHECFLKCKYSRDAKDRELALECETASRQQTPLVPLTETTIGRGNDRLTRQPVMPYLEQRGEGGLVGGLTFQLGGNTGR